MNAILHMDKIREVKLDKELHQCIPEHVFVRIGTIPDGSCFFHAILRGTDRKYIALDEKGRRDYVEDLRNQFYRTTDKTVWFSLGDGSIAVSTFSVMFNNAMSKFYEIVRTGPESANIFIQENFQYFKDFCSLIPEDLFHSEVIVKSLDRKFVRSYKDLASNVEQNTLYLLSDKIRERCDREAAWDALYIRCLIATVVYGVSKLAKDCLETVYQEFKNAIKAVDEWVGDELLDLAMRFLDVDIYIVDAKTKRLYNMSACHLYKNRVSIVLIWTGGNHYEVLGVYNPVTKVLKYSFEPFDPFIRTLQSMC